MGVLGYKRSIFLLGSKTTMLKARKASGNVAHGLDWSRLTFGLEQGY